MKIAIVSDTHWEFDNPTNILSNLQIFPDADYLILAGDICHAKLWNIYADFMIDIFAKYKGVLYIAGNHEYYGTSISQGNEYLRNLNKKIPNLTFLDNQSIELVDGEKSFTVIGGTFWYPISNPHDEMVVRHRLNDFSQIHSFTIDSLNNLYDEFMLEYQKVKDKDNLILLTHHSTSNRYLKFTQYRDALGFGSVLPENVGFNENVKLCIHGHVHIRAEYLNEYNIPTVCNSVGYCGFEQQNFNPMVVEL